MPTITHTDYLAQVSGSGLVALPGLWVRLRNNSTNTDYFSTAVSDAQGAFTHSAVPGDYSAYTGTAATVVGTPTLRNAHYAVPVTAGDDAVFGSATTVVVSPYAPSSLALGGGAVWGTKLIQGPPPSGGDDTTNLTNLIAGGGVTVQLQPGTYNWSVPLSLLGTTWIRGAGRGITVLNWTGGAVAGGNGAMVITGSDNGLQDLTIQGSLGTGAAVGKLVFVAQGAVAANRTHFLRVAFNSTGTNNNDGACLMMTAPITDLWATDCLFTSSAAYTVYCNTLSVSAVTGLHFSHCVGSNSNAAAAGGVIQLSGNGALTGPASGDVLIEDCRLGPCSNNAIQIANRWSRVTISSNTTLACTRMGIEVNGNAAGNGTICQAVTCTGNAVDYTGVATPTGWPISIVAIRTVTCTANTIVGVPGTIYGIEITGADLAAVCNANSIYNVGQTPATGLTAAIIVNGSKRCAVIGNAIDTCTMDGILIYGGNLSGPHSDFSIVSGNSIFNCGTAASASGGVGTAAIEVLAGVNTSQNVIITGNTVATVSSPAGTAYTRGISTGDTGAVVFGNQVSGVAGGVNYNMAAGNPFVIAGSNAQLDNNKTLGFLDSTGALNGLIQMTAGNIFQFAQSVVNGTSQWLLNGGSAKWLLSQQGGADLVEVDQNGVVKILLNALTLSKDLRRSRQTPTETVLVSGVDATAGEIISVTLTAARVVGAPLNPATGQNLTFEFTQGGVGAFAVTWNAIFKKTWSDTGNATGKISSITFYYNGTNWVQTGAQAPYV